ncbi:hypothetical protein ACFW1M_06630 [Streptomyces inhibens]|uniref:hypothetical protein n=1 Tax=Streptomyces inhibens TaxID=2293571 RepID=UPI0036A8E3DE
MKVASPLTWELVIDCEVVVNGMEWQVEASSHFMPKPWLGEAGPFCDMLDGNLCARRSFLEQFDRSG